MGPSIPVGSSAALTLALAIHELITNAIGSFVGRNDYGMVDGRLRGNEAGLLA
jgi:hypothetical protein